MLKRTCRLCSQTVVHSRFAFVATRRSALSVVSITKTTLTMSALFVPPVPHVFEVRLSFRELAAVSPAEHVIPCAAAAQRLRRRCGRRWRWSEIDAGTATDQIAGRGRFRVSQTHHNQAPLKRRTAHRPRVAYAVASPHREAPCRAAPEAMTRRES